MTRKQILVGSTLTCLVFSVLTLTVDHDVARAVCLLYAVVCAAVWGIALSDKPESYRP